MPTDDQKQSLSDAIDQISAAQKALQTASEVATDGDKADKINDLYQKLQTLQTHVLQAEEAADDDAFENAKTVFSGETAVLQADQARIQAIVDDVAVAGQIAGYLAQAAGFLAKI
jgi:tetrahydrodipicolinate N-succinyltransferase